MSKWRIVRKWRTIREHTNEQFFVQRKILGVWWNMETYAILDNAELHVEYRRTPWQQEVVKTYE